MPLSAILSPPPLTKLLAVLGVFLGFLAISALSAPISADAALICVQTTPSDAVVFFVVNYVAHAATVPPLAGAKWYNIFWTIVCLFLPFAGLERSMALVSRHMVHGGNSVEKALARGALLIVSRSHDWKPGTREHVYLKLPENYDFVGSSSTSVHTSATIKVFDLDSGGPVIDHRHVHVHGKIEPPKGYSLTLASKFHLDGSLVDSEDITLSRSQSLLKMAISVAQLVYSCITIYRTQGDQIDRYGYAAFGLSVFPYAFMSLANLICVGVIGEYPCMYVQNTAILEEAKERPGGTFVGVIGGAKDRGSSVRTASSGDDDSQYTLATISLESSSKESAPDILVVEVGKDTRRFRFLTGTEPHPSGHCEFGVSAVFNMAKPPTRESRTIAAKLFKPARWILLLIIPHLFIYLLSRFKTAHSTVGQRAWMMAWVCASQASFVFVHYLLGVLPHASPFAWTTKFSVLLVCGLSILAIPAIGGFVTVWTMLMEFGTCSLLP